MMKILDSLDRKIGKYAIKGLMIYIVTANLAMYLLAKAMPENNITSRLMLIPDLVLQGEVWRIITFIFIPPATSMLWILFTLYFYYLVGSGLEEAWGSFKFNIYYLIGILGTILSVFISGGGATAAYLNLSLFLAFAAVYPNYQILLFFILPVKVKYLAWLDGAFLAYTFFQGDLSIKLMIAAAILNFILFFGKAFVMGIKHTGPSYLKKRNYHQHTVKKGAFHRCTICGITELEDRRLEFRYCRDCSGDHEYCMPHLKDHIHITEKK